MAQISTFTDERLQNAGTSGGPAGIVKLNRPPPPPDPKRRPRPPAWVDTKLAPLIAEVWLTEENSPRFVPLLVPLLVRTPAAAKVKVLGDGGGVWPMTGAGNAGGGAGVEAPVSAAHVDPKTNPPPLPAANENLRGTEVVGGGVPVGTSGAAALASTATPPSLYCSPLAQLFSHRIRKSASCGVCNKPLHCATRRH